MLSSGILKWHWCVFVWSWLAKCQWKNNVNDFVIRRVHCTHRHMCCNAGLCWKKNTSIESERCSCVAPLVDQNILILADLHLVNWQLKTLIFSDCSSPKILLRFPEIFKTKEQCTANCLARDETSIFLSEACEQVGKLLRVFFMQLASSPYGELAAVQNRIRWWNCCLSLSIWSCFRVTNQCFLSSREVSGLALCLHHVSRSVRHFMQSCLVLFGICLVKS